MTLSPSTSSGVTAVKGPHYVPPKQCSAPGCDAREGDVHHLFRRSKIGLTAWVEIDGETIGNLVRLCREHHAGVTGEAGAGHRWWIRWDETSHKFLWCNVVGDDPAWPQFQPVAPLDPQPPALSLDVPQPAATESEPDRCPQCGHPRRRAPAIAKAGARRRKSWLVKVPDDHEDGAEILDTLVDDLAPLLSLDPGASARYHVLVPVLVYAQQDRKSFAEAIKGIGG